MSGLVDQQKVYRFTGKNGTFFLQFIVSLSLYFIIIIIIIKRSIGLAGIISFLMMEKGPRGKFLIKMAHR